MDHYVHLTCCFYITF